MKKIFNQKYINAYFHTKILVYYFCSIISFTQCVSYKNSASYVGKYINEIHNDYDILELNEDSSCFYCYKFLYIQRQNYGKWKDKGDYIEATFISNGFNEIEEVGQPVHGTFIFRKTHKNLIFLHKESRWGSVDLKLKRVK